MFEGVPNYPDAGRFWDVVDKHKVNIFIPRPRPSERLWGQATSRRTGRPVQPAPFGARSVSRLIRSLDVVSQAGGPRAVHCRRHLVADGNRRVHDYPAPWAHSDQPGSATKPFFGVRPVVLEPESGKVIEETEAAGVLAIADSWPGQMRTVLWRSPAVQGTYFRQYKGFYFTGDGCAGTKMATIGSPGAWTMCSTCPTPAWHGGSGERAGRASKSVRGRGGWLPTRRQRAGHLLLCDADGGNAASDDLAVELRNWVRKEIGPIASPDHIQFAPDCPRRVSGKIMRRILRKVPRTTMVRLETRPRWPIRAWSTI